MTWAPNLHDEDELAAFAHEDPYWLTFLEEGLRVADALETEEYGEERVIALLEHLFSGGRR